MEAKEKLQNPSAFCSKEASGGGEADLRDDGTCSLSSLKALPLSYPLNYFQDQERKVLSVVSSDTQGDIAQYKPKDFIY